MIVCLMILVRLILGILNRWFGLGSGIWRRVCGWNVVIFIMRLSRVRMRIGTCISVRGRWVMMVLIRVRLVRNLGVCRRGLLTIM